MVEANLRSSSRSKMSAMEWKMFSAFSSRQSCLYVNKRIKESYSSSLQGNPTRSMHHTPVGKVSLTDAGTLGMGKAQQGCI